MDMQPYATEHLLNFQQLSPLVHRTELPTEIVPHSFSKEAYPGSSVIKGSGHATRLKAHTMTRVTDRDDEILTAVRAGSPEAFAELHAIYSRRLYKKIIAITKSPEDAEDALQDTFLRVYRAIHTFEGRSTLYSWLTQIAINSALLVLRKRRARSEILFDPQPGTAADIPGLEIKDLAPDPEQACYLQQRRVQILRAMHKLDPPLKGPIRMRMAKGLSVREISQALNISEATVKTRLHRARRRLSMHLRRLTAKKGNEKSCPAPR